MSKISQDMLENWFTFHTPPDEATIEAYEQIRQAGKAFAEVIVRLTPPSADQSSAIRRIREVVYIANAAIACGGK